MDTTDEYSTQELSGEALARWFDADTRGRFVLEDDLTLRWCNAAARELLSSGRLLLHNGRIRPRDPGEGQQLLDLVRRADGRLAVYCMQAGEEDAHLVLTARRLHDTSLIGLTAYHSGESFTYHWADLSQAFGLTASERQIVEALGSGLTADAVADRLRISVKTVRTHIRHVYSKLGVSSREELFRKLAPYMLAD